MILIKQNHRGHEVWRETALLTCHNPTLIAALIEAEKELRTDLDAIQQQLTVAREAQKATS